MSEEWPVDYHRRKATLLSNGLLCRLKFSVDDDFISLHVEVLGGEVLRETPWQRHVTLGFTGEIAPSLQRKVRKRWHNKVTKLRFDWVGSGGAGFINNCRLSRCRLVRAAKKLGYYRDRQLHISF